MSSWHDTIIACHLAVTDQVSHYERMKSDRYFVWQEEDANGYRVNNRRGDYAMAGSTDLFTKQEFDPWCEQFEAALDSMGVSWYKASVQHEDETQIIHHEWRWEVLNTG